MGKLLRYRLLWALLFGLISAALLFLYLRNVSLETVAEPKVPVVVAAGPVEAGTVLTADKLAIAQWPQSAVLPGRLSSIGEAAGQMTTVELTAGQPVLLHQIHPQEHVGHGGRVPLGMRLVTLTVNPTMSIGYRLTKGDKVDLMRVYKDSRGLNAEMVLQAVEVYALGEETATPARPGAATGTASEPRTVTLMLKAQDVLLVSLLAEEDSVRLALRPAGDTETPELAPVSKVKQ